MNPFKLYVRSQKAQLRWIRKHPIMWITLNVIGIVAFIGYIEYADRREWNKPLEPEYDIQN